MSDTTADRLRRMAEARGTVGVPTSMGSWYVMECDREAYLLESLHCVLTHAEPLIALRAYGQACAYLAELRGKVAGYAFLSDALLEGRNRLETHIGRARFEAQS